MVDTDIPIRTKAFDWLTEQSSIHGDVLPRRPLLEKGFIFRGENVPLLSAQGIFKPRIMNLPISITTSPESPYDDSFGEDGLIRYKYRGTDPNHRDNVGLRLLMERRIPLIYFHGIIPNRYLTIWPTFIVGDDPASLTFQVAVEDKSLLNKSVENEIAESDIARRTYLTTSIRQRLHQRGFREKVLQAYRDSCALCRLRHRELLDAAHIIPDNEPEGLPLVTNGLSLCKLHHSAFDSFIIGITPDYEIVVRTDVLEEIDGPVLQYALKNMHKSKLILPTSIKDRPNRDHLAWRFEKFKSAG
jgi:putative restriction endonuclease